MRVLVVGATGLIGSRICAALAGKGHRVRGVARSLPARAPLDIEMIRLDLATATRPDVWQPLLRDMDAVVNCAGVLQDGPRDRTGTVHAEAASALFQACESAGVRRVIHFSAIGVDRAQPSAFSASKLAGDRDLTGRDLDWVILRPSVVLGPAVFGASALIRGLAALPVLPSMPGGAPLQVVRLDDVVATVLFFLSPGAKARVALDLAGPQALSFDQIVARYRRWFGWPEQRVVRIPAPLAALLYRLGDLAGLLGWRPPVRGNAMREMTRGATGDPAPWTAATGIAPQSLDAALQAEPATVQDRWFARLYFIKPLTFVTLPFFWIMTGIVSLTTGYGNGVLLMLGAGAGALSGPSVVAGALADIVVGVTIALRRWSALGLLGALGLCLFYFAAGTVLRPDLWHDPLGPLLKVFPIVALHLAALAILEER